VADNGVINPWTVSGEIDYNKLIERFGTKPIDWKLLDRFKKYTGGLHFHLRRGVFYSHRDLDVVLDEFEKGNRFVAVPYIWVTLFHGYSRGTFNKLSTRS